MTLYNNLGLDKHLKYQQVGVSFASLLYYCGPVIVICDTVVGQFPHGCCLCVWFKQRFVIDVSRESWGWIFVLGIVNTGIGCYLYFAPLAKLPVQTVAICGYLEPLSAVVFSAILLGEKMTAAQIMGAFCIIGGAMIGEFCHVKKIK